MPQGDLENLPLKPLLDELQEALALIQDNKTLQARQKLEQTVNTYKAICFECRIVQYPKDISRG